MITLEHTVEEIEHLWKVLEAHLGVHQQVMKKVQTQVQAQMPVVNPNSVANDEESTVNQQVNA